MATPKTKRGTATEHADVQAERDQNAALKDDILHTYKDFCKIVSREYDVVPKNSAEQSL